MWGWGLRLSEVLRHVKASWFPFCSSFQLLTVTKESNRDRTRHLHEFLNFLFADILRETRDQKGRMTSTNVLHRRKKNTKNTKIQNSSRTAQRTATGAHWLSTANISRLSNAFFYDHWPKKAYVKHNRSQINRHFRH